MRGDAGAGLFSLRGSFEQKLMHIARAQTLHQIIKRAVLESPVATAVRFAARQVLFDIGRAQTTRGRVKPRQQGRPVFLQGGGGLFGNHRCPSHKYRQGIKASTKRWRWFSPPSGMSCFTVPRHHVFEVGEHCLVGFFPPGQFFR